MLRQLTEARDKAQAEFATAQVSLLEARARATEAESVALKLEAAVAALKGETPVEPLTAVNVVTGVIHTAPDSPPTAERAVAREISPEEFDKQRKQRQKKRQAEIDAANPLAHVRCGGCGVTGKMNDTIMQAASGATIRMMVCSGCNNQVMT